MWKMLKMTSIRNILFFALILSVGANNELNFLKRSLEQAGTVINHLTNATRDTVKTAINALDSGIDMAIDTKNIVVDKLTELLENFRRKMGEGLPELGIPRLEPLSINHADINMDHEIGIAKGSIDEVQIHDLSLFLIKNLEHRIPYTVIMNLTFPTITIDGRYDVKGVIGDMFNIFGNGPFNLTMYNVQVGLEAKLSFKSLKFSLSYLQLTIVLEKMKCNFENLMDGGENGDIFNKVFGDLAPEAIDYFWPDIGPKIEETVKKVFEVGLIPKGLLRFSNRISSRFFRLFYSIG